MNQARKYRLKTIPTGIFSVIGQHSEPKPPGPVLRNDETGEEITVTNEELKNGKEWEPIQD